MPHFSRALEEAIRSRLQELWPQEETHTGRHERSSRKQKEQAYNLGQSLMPSQEEIISLDLAAKKPSTSRNYRRRLCVVTSSARE